MIFEPDTVKGFRDYFPPDSLRRDALKKTAEKYFKLYGFVPVETPIIEYDELMKSDSLEGEDDAVGERFRLKDRGGRNLGLRYEFTFQLARIFKTNPNIKLPFKRYQVGNVFRDEPIRLGRTRQFTQCDIDIIGDNSVNADAECLAVISDILKELKIKDFEIQINNRKLLNEIINSVQISDKRQVMRELDKMEKIGEDQVKANLRPYANPDQIITLFKMMEKDLDFYIKNAFDGAEELNDLVEKCKIYGIKVKFSPGMIRGFGYYTGNIFEFIVEKTSIIAGGRYDNLIGKYIGRELPAVGISFSLESLMALCQKQISKLDIESVPKAILISINEDKEAIKLSAKLRNENISCSTMFGKPGKAMEFADSQSVPFVIFVGSDEVKSKKFKLRDMKSGEEKLLTEKQLISRLKK